MVIFQSYMKLQQADWYHLLPSQGKEILQKLQKAGFTAYLVGGAVRDLLLGKTPKDFDYVTNAKPEEISVLFPKTLEIGKKFGISIVVLEDLPCELATFRQDGDYEDGRHPEEIFFATPEEDALRRDFTINGLFWDSQSKNIIDYVGGLEDLVAKKIRAIGNAEKRFQEDALRMLRALRFLSQLSKFDFSIDNEIRSGILTLKENLHKVSKERITQEMQLILQSHKPSLALQKMRTLGLWEIIFPFPAVDDATFLALDNLHKTGEYSAASLWAMLLPASTPPKESTKNFILPRQTLDEIKSIQELCTVFPQAEKFSIVELKTLLAHPLFSSAASVLRARNIATSAIQFCEEKIVLWEKTGTLNPPELLTGADLIAFGYKPGKQFQEILRAVRVAQLEEKILTKEEAVTFVKSRF